MIYGKDYFFEIKCKKPAKTNFWLYDTKLYFLLKVIITIYNYILIRFLSK